MHTVALVNDTRCVVAACFPQHLMHTAGSSAAKWIEIDRISSVLQGLISQMIYDDLLTKNRYTKSIVTHSRRPRFGTAAAAGAARRTHTQNAEVPGQQDFFKLRELISSRAALHFFSPCAAVFVVCDDCVDTSDTQERKLFQFSTFAAF